MEKERLRYILVSILFTVIFSSSNAQTVAPEITASAGGQGQVGAWRIDWTVGEAVVLTMEQVNVILTNGFHQNNRFCLGDLNNDGNVNSADLGLFLAQLGCSNDCTADFNFDGFVNTADLGLFLSALGTTCN
jgi:hypothetical protein